MAPRQHNANSQPPDVGLGGAPASSFFSEEDLKRLLRLDDTEVLQGAASLARSAGGNPAQILMDWVLQKTTPRGRPGRHPKSQAQREVEAKAAARRDATRWLIYSIVTKAVYPALIESRKRGKAAVVEPVSNPDHRPVLRTLLLEYFQEEPGVLDGLALTQKFRAEVRSREWSTGETSDLFIALGRYLHKVAGTDRKLRSFLGLTVRASRRRKNVQRN